MLDFFICMIISIMISIGMSIALVEKGKDFPIRKYRVILQKIIRRYVGKKWGKVLECSACSSFWLTACSDVIISIIAACHGVFYFLWPFSGFVALGIVFVIIEHLNAMEKQQNINLVIGDNSENKGE
jgi:hypothetical protein